MDSTDRKSDREVFLERIETLRGKLYEIRIDADFISFVAGWTGLIGSEVEELSGQKFSQSFLKKVKRKAQKEGGKEYWKEIHGKSLKPRLKMKLYKNLFRMEPVAPNPRHRPARSYPLILTTDYLREYFFLLTGKPQMERYIAPILGKSYNVLNSEWSRGRKLLEGKDSPETGQMGFLDLCKWYATNIKRVLVALQTGIPVYMQKQDEQNGAKDSVRKSPVKSKHRNRPHHPPKTVKSEKKEPKDDG